MHAIFVEQVVTTSNDVLMAGLGLAKACNAMQVGRGLEDPGIYRGRVTIDPPLKSVINKCLEELEGG